MKPFWKSARRKPQKCLQVTSWRRRLRIFPRRRAFIAVPLARRDAMTMCASACKGARPGAAKSPRVGRWTCRRTFIRRSTNARNDVATTWFAERDGAGRVPRRYTVMNNWSANHGRSAKATSAADLISLASMLRIPVAMHNVLGGKNLPAESWNLFGALELQAADYRASRISARFTVTSDQPRSEASARRAGDKGGFDTLPGPLPIRGGEGESSPVWLVCFTVHFSVLGIRLRSFRVIPPSPLRREGVVEYLRLASLALKESASSVVEIRCWRKPPFGLFFARRKDITSKRRFSPAPISTTDDADSF